MLIWNREVLNPLNDLTEDKNLVNKILKTYNKFLLSDINKVCSVDFRTNIKLMKGNSNEKDCCFDLLDNDSSLFMDKSDVNISKLFNDVSCSSVLGNTLDSQSHFNGNNQHGKIISNCGSTMCSSVDSQNGGILNNKNINFNDEINSFEFQAQYFLEQ